MSSTSSSVEISPDLSNLLQALRALLELGNARLVKSAADAISELNVPHPEVRNILDLVAGMKYVEAKRLVDDLLSRGTRLVRWEDPEIRLLEVELDEVTTALAGAEAERAEVERQLLDFNHRFHEELGDLISRILRRRRDTLRRKAGDDPTMEVTIQVCREVFSIFRESGLARFW